ncbi:nuclear transport factor 2 family protein [Streptomyces sp. NPDC002143]
MTTDAVATARRFLEGVFALDAETAVADLADDIVMDFPLSPEGLPRHVEGREAAVAVIRSIVPDFWKEIRSTRMDIRFEADPERCVAEFASEGILANGKPYIQSYVSLFTVRDGKIVQYAEYCDPFPILDGLGGK